MLQPNPTMQSGHAFSRVPQANVNRSAFDRSHRVGTTFDAGYLIPFWQTYGFPGDTVSVQPAIFARVATLLFPIMDRLFMDIHFWFIPFRLIDQNFERMFGQQDSPGDSVDFSVPQIAWTTTSPVTVGSLFDYLNWVPGLTNVSLSAYKPRAYNLLYNTWYKDQNLQNAVPVNRGVGPDSPADYTLLRRGKRHDYFTSAAPFAQKGNAVTIPIGLTAPVTGSLVFTGPTADTTAGTNLHDISGGNHNVAINTTVAAGNSFSATTQWQAGGVLPTGLAVVSTFVAANSLHFTANAAGQLSADLSSATGVSINQFRLGATLQQYLEINARSGTRFPEFIRAHFGVTSPDARLQRPEFLGGGTVPLNVHQVEQTSPAGSGAVGDLAAFGVVAHSGRGLGFTQSITEHGLFMGLLSVRADYTYSQGIPREDRYLTKYDFYVPTFANLGEQPIRKQEIFAQGGSVDDETWGWQERWAEMRYQPSSLTGLMRPGVAGSLGDAWTVAQHFASLPGLNSDFIVENPPLDRVIAVPSQPHFILDGYVHHRSVRAMPLYSVPGLTRI